MDDEIMMGYQDDFEQLMEKVIQAQKYAAAKDWDEAEARTFEIVADIDQLRNTYPDLEASELENLNNMQLMALSTLSAMNQMMGNWSKTIFFCNKMLEVLMNDISEPQRTNLERLAYRGLYTAYVKTGDLDMAEDVKETMVEKGLLS